MKKVMASKAGGRYMPLSLYKRDGYSDQELANLEQNCESKFDDELQVLVYKLTVTEKWELNVHKEVSNEILQLKNGRVRKALQCFASTPSPKKPRRSSSSSDTDSSSDSDSEGKAGEQKAETTAAKKEQARIERAAKQREQAEKKGEAEG